MTGYPRGFVPAWALLFGGAVALVIFHLVQQPASSPPALAGPKPVVTTTVTATVTLGVPAVASSPPHVSLPAVGGGRHAVTSSGATSVSQRTGAPPPPSPSPSQSPPPGQGAVVKAAIVVPLRGATPIAVRASVVAPSAPPFPSPTPALGIEIQLPGLAVTALP